MTKNELIDYIKYDNQGGRKTKETHFQKHLNEIYNEIVEFNEKYHLNNNFTWKQKLYNYSHNIINILTCLGENCNKKVKFNSNENRYDYYCSRNCTHGSKLIINKTKNTCIKKYGVENPMQNKEIKIKSRNAFVAKYSDKNSINHKKLQDKRISTFQKKYGADHPMQVEKIKEKVYETNIKRYGAKTSLLNEEVKNKGIETNIRLYGCECPMKTDIIKEKLNNSNIKKYGNIRYVLTEKYYKESRERIDKNTINVYSKKLSLSIASIKIINEIDFEIKNYCEKHEQFIISKRNLCNRLLYNVNICTECHPISNHDSIGEVEIKDFINIDLNIETEKIKINTKEIDIFSYFHKFGIEYDGIYWHSEIYKDKNYHLNKTLLCKDYGVNLIHIFENEWINKKDIIKNIIKENLNVIENEINTKDCILRNVNNEDSIKFLKNNHIKENSENNCDNIQIGLYYNYELVSIMILNKINNNDYELWRFCNKINTTINNSANILLNYFLKIYLPKSIFTFIDRRYSNETLFLTLGFDIIETIKPVHWYYNLKERKLYSKDKFKKEILIKEEHNPNKTEFEIMNYYGFLKIYDCGYLKMVLKII